LSEIPPIPAPNIATIPDELKKRHQWVCWRFDLRDGKLVKVPIAPWVTGDTRPVSVTDPNNLSTFAQAIMYAEKFNCGIGFVFFKGAGVTGIDLDHIKEYLKDEADEILKKANTYAEYSPSGLGIHIIGYGTVDRPIKRPGIEVYSEDRFFTVTGRHVEGTPTTLNNIQALLDELQEKFGEKPKPITEAKPVKGWEDYVNELGYTLKEVREKDKVLDEYLKGGLAGKPSDSEADMGTLERLLFWGYSPEEAVSILKFYRWREKLKRDDYIRGMLDKLLPVGERARPKQGEKPDHKKYFVEEKFIPSILAEEIMQEYRFITMRDNEQMYVWFDGCYRPYAESLIKEECKRRLGEEFRANRASEVIEYIKASTFTERREEPPHLIPLLNGVLDINTMELKPLSPDYMFFNLLPVRYDPEAKCPKIEKFLNDVAGCKEDIELLLEVIGFCLYREYFIAIALLLVGEGANGKTTFLNLVKRFLGQENVSGRSLQELEENRFAKADLYHKLANIYSDLPDKALWSTGTFKMLTGRDLIHAERKFQQPFTFENYAKLLFSANKVPETYDESDAFFRRWIIVVFPNTFTSDKADPQILDKITTPEELSGLLNLALAALKRLLERGRFSYSKTTEEIRADYTRKSSPIGAFVMDCLNVDPDAFIPKQDLYNVFAEYCRVRKIPCVTKDTFFKNLPQHIPVIDHRPKLGNTRVVTFKGIRFSEGVSGLSNVSRVFYILSSRKGDFANGLWQVTDVDGEIAKVEIKNTAPLDSLDSSDTSTLKTLPVDPASKKCEKLYRCKTCKCGPWKTLEMAKEHARLTGHEIEEVGG